MIRNRNARVLFAVFAALLLGGAFLPAAAAQGADKPAVLITGANRGIGLEMASQFAAAGWEVIGTARKPDNAADLKALGVRIEQLDVTDPDSVRQLSESLDDVAIDVLINNAGIFPRVSSIDETNFDDVARAFSINTIGPMRVTRALLPNLRLGERKVVANMSSQLGSITNNSSGGAYGYRESKAALNMFTRSLSAELDGEGFICVMLHPGWVQTDMGGANATLTPTQSVAGLRKVIEELDDGDDGRFLAYDGAELPF